MKLSIIIPVYNEEKTILKILIKVKEADTLGLKKEIIIVDDGSTDGTKAQISKLKLRSNNIIIKMIEHRQNQGKGAAVQSGLKAASGDILLIQDADLEYSPRDYPRLLRPIVEKQTKVVYGSRLMKMKFSLFGKNPTPLPLHYLGNRFLSWATSFLYCAKITDMETGYKVMRKEVYKRLHLAAKRFELEPEITAKILKMGYKILETPITIKPRGYKEGKKISWKDGIKALFVLLKYRFLERDDIEKKYGFDQLTIGKRYSNWIYQTIKPYLRNPLLEIGCGVGNMTEFMKQEHRVIATDIDPKFLKQAEKRLGVGKNIRFELFNIEKKKKMEDQVFTIIGINVLEHIKEDEKALENMYNILQPGGRVVILVPALRWLFSSLDKHFGHYRRYTRTELIEKLQKAKFKIEKMHYFNLLGIVYWFILGKILRRKTFFPLTGRTVNFIVPISQILESQVSPVGLSLLVIAKKI
ncbi:glycosyltransferase [Candidatus Microgenomates bacterium]|nr:glycosyltransferase [Candidatus Microgenomates bacterium]